MSERYTGYGTTCNLMKSVRNIRKIKRERELK